MSIGSTNTDAINDGGRTPAVSSKRLLQVEDQALQALIYLNIEQLRQLAKIALLLENMSGISIDDSNIDTPTF